MILIKTKNGTKYWTESYTLDEQNFLVFDSDTKSGSVRSVRLNQDCVEEISEIRAKSSSKQSKIQESGKKDAFGLAPKAVLFIIVPEGNPLSRVLLTASLEDIIIKEVENRLFNLY